MFLYGTGVIKTKRDIPGVILEMAWKWQDETIQTASY